MAWTLESEARAVILESRRQVVERGDVSGDACYWADRALDFLVDRREGWTVGRLLRVGERDRVVAALFLQIIMFRYLWRGYDAEAREAIGLMLAGREDTAPYLEAVFGGSLPDRVRESSVAGRNRLRVKHFRRQRRFERNRQAW